MFLYLELLRLDHLSWRLWKRLLLKPLTLITTPKTRYWSLPAFRQTSRQRFCWGWAGWPRYPTKSRWRSYRWLATNLFAFLPPKRQPISYRFLLALLKEWYQMEAFLLLRSGTPCALGCRIWRCISSGAGGHERPLLPSTYKRLWPDLSPTQTL